MSENQNRRPNGKLYTVISVLLMVIAIIIYVRSGGTETGSSDYAAVDSIVAEEISNNTDVSDESEMSSEEGKSEDTDISHDAEISEEPETVIETEPESLVEKTEYRFRNSKLLNQHYEKHGIEMGFDSAREYEEAASEVINNPSALHKTEAEDGDYVYYVEDTNEFVILSKDGYIRTYFYPNAGLRYYERQ